MCGKFGVDNRVVERLIVVLPCLKSRVEFKRKGSHAVRFKCEETRSKSCRFRQIQYGKSKDCRKRFGYSSYAYGNLRGKLTRCCIGEEEEAVPVFSSTDVTKVGMRVDELAGSKVAAGLF